MILLLKKQWSVIAEILILKQTVFALPFAYIGMLLAGYTIVPPQVPTFKIWVLVTLAMIGARTAGMSFNRIIDRKIDLINPRTKDRAVAAGRISVMAVWLLAFASLTLLLLSAYELNSICFYLSPIAGLLLFGYSYCKRFTWFSHFVLGIVESFAPIGGWLAVTGTFHIVPVLLGLLIVFWMVGLDVIYACQDYEHDQRVGLYSIPSYFGLSKAFIIAKIAHMLSVLCIVVVGFLLSLGLYYWLGVVVVIGLFIYEHSLVSPKDLSKVPKAFFQVNSWIAITLCFFIGLEFFSSVLR